MTDFGLGSEENNANELYGPYYDYERDETETQIDGYEANDQIPYITEEDFADLIALQFEHTEDNENSIIQPPSAQYCLLCRSAVDDENTLELTTYEATFVCLICMETFENTRGYGCQCCLKETRNPCCCEECNVKMTTKRNQEVQRFREYVDSIRSA
jgi:hypothetical protein